MKQGRGRPTPVAPPAYRPMPVPKVLQRKTVAAGPTLPVTPPQRTVPHVLQRKEITRSQTPPVPVKPTLNPLVQRNQKHARPGTSRPTILQPKVIQRAKWSYGQSDAEMSDQQWFKSGMSTFASIMVDDGDEELTLLGLGKSNKTVKFGAAHAEDVAMRTLLEEYSAEELSNLSVILNLSKSPCSSTYGTSGAKDPGCAENLIAFKKKYKVKISLTCRGLYKGAEESQKAVELLRDNGIDVSVDVRLGAQKRFGEQKGAK